MGVKRRTNKEEEDKIQQTGNKEAISMAHVYMGAKNMDAFFFFLMVFINVCCKTGKK